MSGSGGWLHYYHHNQDLEDSEYDPEANLRAEEDRRRAINPFLGGKPHTLSEGLEEAVSGSAWMFYNHYNPELTQALQQILVGERVEDVVNTLVEVSDKERSRRKIGAGTGAIVGGGLGAYKFAKNLPAGNKLTKAALGGLAGATIGALAGGAAGGAYHKMRNKKKKGLVGEQVDDVVNDLLETDIDERLKTALGLGAAAGLGYLRGVNRGPRKYHGLRKQAAQHREHSKAMQDRADKESDPAKKKQFSEFSKSFDTAAKKKDKKATSYKRHRIGKYNDK